VSCIRPSYKTCRQMSCPRSGVWCCTRCCGEATAKQSRRGCDQRREIALMSQMSKLALHMARWTAYRRLTGRICQAQLGWLPGYGVAEAGLTVALAMQQARVVQHPLGMALGGGGSGSSMRADDVPANFLQSYRHVGRAAPRKASADTSLPLPQALSVLEPFRAPGA
jgi:hypothetical protein